MDQSKLTVLSLNVFGAPFHPLRIVTSFMRNNVRGRFRIIADVIKKTQSDVLILQEVHDYPHYYFLRKLLPEYRYAVAKRMFYGPRGGIVILSKQPLHHAHYYDFQDKGKMTNKSITGHLTVKGILLAKLKGTDLWLGNTHLTQNSDHTWEKDNRYVTIIQAQLKQLAIHTRAIQQRGERLIMGGDFNLPKEYRYYREFLKETDYKDAFVEDFFPTYHTAFLPKGDKAERIDYIFYSGKIKLLENDYILQKPLKDVFGEDFYPSDHLGLKATFSLT